MDIQASLKKYRGVADRAVDYTLKFQGPDGGYIWEGYVNDAYHKQGFSWSLAGHAHEAHRLLDWAKAKLQPDGQLKDYKGDVYKQTWFFMSAHHLGHFELSYPGISFLLSYQAPCGGFPRFTADDRIRGVSTSFMGLAALHFGRLDVARQAAQCCMDMLEQQPDESKFFFLMTKDGKLVTDKEDPEALHIDITKPKQKYYEVGIPIILMCRLHLITGEKPYLDYAQRFLEFNLNCYEDGFANVASGKGALGAAIYTLITGDERGAEAAQRFCDFLVDTQLPDGSWIDLVTEPDELLYYVDHAICFNVWLREIARTLEIKEAVAPAGAK